LQAQTLALTTRQLDAALIVVILAIAIALQARSLTLAARLPTTTTEHTISNILTQADHLLDASLLVDATVSTDYRQVRSLILTAGALTGLLLSSYQVKQKVCECCVERIKGRRMSFRIRLDLDDWV
jgi:hypothetical protein